MKKRCELIVFLVLLVSLSAYQSLHLVSWSFGSLADDIVYHVFADGSSQHGGDHANTYLSSSLARANLVKELESISYRYYIYSDGNISQDKPSWTRPLYHARYGHQEYTEREIHNVLKNHSLRTENPDDAELYIVSTPVARVITSSGLSYDEAFSALLSHPIYQKYHGNKHVILSLALVTYNYENRNNVGILTKWLPSLANVTAALGCDPIAAYSMYERGELAGNDYEYPFSLLKPMAHHSFSVGIGSVDRDIPITPASLEKYNQSTYFIFYHTTTATSLFNATRFRHAPVVNVSLSALPNSSIGFDITKEEWLSRMKDSKFCLAIRGDNPQSHALLRSVRAGCIPVVISDLWPIYAPSLKSSLMVEYYSIIIKEADFIQNPEKALLQLMHLNTSVIEEKIANLSLAQRVLLPDHPDSLFVPAFLKEAMIAMEYTAKVYYY